MNKFAALIREHATKLAELDSVAMGRPVHGHFDCMIAAGSVEYDAVSLDSFWWKAEDLILVI